MGPVMGIYSDKALREHQDSDAAATAARHGVLLQSFVTPQTANHLVNVPDDMSAGGVDALLRQRRHQVCVIPLVGGASKPGILFKLFF